MLVPSQEFRERLRVQGGEGREGSRQPPSETQWSFLLAATVSGDKLGRGERSMTPEREDACLLLCLRPLTVQLITSSPGAPPPPLSPDGATEGTVRVKEHRCVMLVGKSPSTCLESILSGTSQFIFP